MTGTADASLAHANLLPPSRASREGGHGISVELLSIHIPKAAGNSFRRALVRRYGARIARLYHDFHEPVDYRRILARRPDARAVHGHVGLDPLRSAYPRARTVVWFRHPVDRLLSYHAYWLSVKPHGNPTHDAFLRGDRSPRSLAELLRHEVAGYLGATPVEELDFVGVVEHFDEDLARFERWFDAAGLGRNVPGGPWDRLARWGARLDGLRAPRANRTRRKHAVDPDARHAVAEVLRDEMAIYDRACACREATPGPPERGSVRT